MGRQGGRDFYRRRSLCCSFCHLFLESLTALVGTRSSGKCPFKARRKPETNLNSQAACGSLPQGSHHPISLHLLMNSPKNRDLILPHPGHPVLIWAIEIQRREALGGCFTWTLTWIMLTQKRLIYWAADSVFCIQEGMVEWPNFQDSTCQIPPFPHVQANASWRSVSPSGELCPWPWSANLPVFSGFVSKDWARFTQLLWLDWALYLCAASLWLDEASSSRKCDPLWYDLDEHFFLNHGCTFNGLYCFYSWQYQS